MPLTLCIEKNPWPYRRVEADPGNFLDVDLGYDLRFARGELEVFEMQQHIESRSRRNKHVHYKIARPFVAAVTG